MSEYESKLTIRAPADKVFAFVSDVDNLPRYLPTVTSASPQSGERVQVEGEVEGKHYDSDGYFKVDAQARRMEWGSDGENRYRGWLSVAESGEGHGSSAEITVHLSFEPNATQERRFAEQTGDRDRTIQEGIEHALHTVQGLCETPQGLVEPRTESRTGRGDSGASR